ncbi:MAG: radical SAM family heme chaperone HemW [Micrococcales bacterium]
MAQSIDLGEAMPANGQLPETVANGADSRSWHAYVHVPFCRVRCGYCDFNTYTAAELGSGEGAVSQANFADHLIAEIEFSQRVILAASLPSRPLKSVFFGGGTPTQLPARDLVRILDSLKDAFGFALGAEITTEANPDNVDAEYLEELAEGGFTRVSFGMQSAVPAVLATLERTHQPENVPSAVKAAKSAGLAVSVDLIYGAPGETLDQWRESLEAAIALEPDHISAYSLIVEEGTKLARQISRGELTEPDEDLQADKYELADQLLERAGFAWYEVSNWAKSPEQRSRHNLSYWQSQDWWGYGPGAHSHIGGTRWWNVKHPSAYVQRLSALTSPAHSREVLGDDVRAEERILLEIRTVDGLAVELAKQVNPNASRVIAQAIADQLIDAKAALQGLLLLTLKGRLLADALVRDLIG